MTDGRYDPPRERRHPQRRGRGAKTRGRTTDTMPGRTEETMIKSKNRPDFTRAETYMREQAPAVADRTRSDVEAERLRLQEIAYRSMQRGRAFKIAAAFLAVGILLIGLSDLYGPVVDGIAGVFATFAIATTIHVLRPRPMLRFGLVVIALACLAVTFATVLDIHLHGLRQ